VARPVEIISTVARRRRWTAEEKVEILDEAFRGGSSVAATSDRRGVSRALIYLWRRQAREGRIAGVVLAEPEKSAFVPVHVTAITDQRCAAPPTRTARTAREQRRVGRIEIELTNGRIIKVEECIDPAALALLVAALDGGAR